MHTASDADTVFERYWSGHWQTTCSLPSDVQNTQLIFTKSEYEQFTFTDGVLQLHSNWSKRVVLLFHGPSTRPVETRARQHGPCWRVMETGHPSTRAVNSGRQLG